MNLIQTLILHKADIASVFPFNLNEIATTVSDCSANNQELTQIDVTNAESYYEYAQNFLKEQNAVAGVGGYLEERLIYQGRDLFEQTEEARNIHLGIDVSVAAGTSIHAPLDATIHSFADNNTFGDYGPVIILEHQLDGLTFYTLYGHLSRQSLVGKEDGQSISKGEAFATLGDMHENGNWPPHLHFQLITDMLDYKGDFPGVCAKSKLEYYKQLCPNPNYILQIDKLPY